MCTYQKNEVNGRVVGSKMRIQDLHLDTTAHVVLSRGHRDGLPGNVNAEGLALGSDVGKVCQNLISGLVAATDTRMSIFKYYR
jgi:hypothetical protein